MKYNLSEITEIIKNRRTIYPEFFSERKVHKEIVEKLLNNAVWAPSHGLTQPWRFKVFMNDARVRLSDFLSELYKEKNQGEKFNEKKFEKLKHRPLKSSVVIVVCMERDPKGRITELDEIMATAAAVENLMLTATAYGLGVFWATPGLINTQEVREFLNLENGLCLGFLYVGYPANEWPKGQRKPIEYVTEFFQE
ncbi:MAG: nitroreductase [Bacteroidia bacterium]